MPHNPSLADFDGKPPIDFLGTGPIPGRTSYIYPRKVMLCSGLQAFKNEIQSRLITRVQKCNLQTDKRRWRWGKKNLCNKCKKNPQFFHGLKREWLQYRWLKKKVYCFKDWCGHQLSREMKYMPNCHTIWRLILKNPLDSKKCFSCQKNFLFAALESYSSYLVDFWIHGTYAQSSYLWFITNVSCQIFKFILWIFHSPPHQI